MTTTIETLPLTLLGTFTPTAYVSNAWRQTGVTLPAAPKELLYIHVGKLGKIAADQPNTKWQGFNAAEFVTLNLKTIREAPAITNVNIDWAQVPDDAASLFWVDITTYAIARDSNNQILIWWVYPNSGTPNTAGPNPLTIYTTKSLTIAALPHSQVGQVTLDEIRILAGDLAASPILTDAQASYIASRHVDSDNAIIPEEAAREYAQIAASFQRDISPERSQAFTKRAAELASSKIRYMQQ